MSRGDGFMTCVEDNEEPLAQAEPGGAGQGRAGPGRAGQGRVRLAVPSQDLLVCVARSEQHLEST